MLLAKSASTHYTLHATHSEYSTRTVGKDYERLVCYTGSLAYFPVKEKYFSRIILVGLMRTQDDGTFRTGMALSTMTCTVGHLSEKPNFSTVLV